MSGFYDIPKECSTTSWHKITDYCSSFESMGLTEDLLRGIYCYGLERPAQLQAKAIKSILLGKDVIAEAQSEIFAGVKAETISIGILQLLVVTKTECQALVLAPTRELAKNTTYVINSLAEFMSTPVKVHACIGETAGEDSDGILQNGVHVVIGTPAQVFDMINSGGLKVDSVKLLVLDECDEMLSHGFKDQIHDVFKHMPETVQCTIFSATMPHEVADVAQKIMSEPRVLVRLDELHLEGVRQFIIEVNREDWKNETVDDLLAAFAYNRAIIYCNTREKVDCLMQRLRERDFLVSSMHQDQDPRERHANLKYFRSGLSRVLITTYIITNGHLGPVNLKINYDLPPNKESYLLQIGHAGAFGFGRKNAAINFITHQEVEWVSEMEYFYNTQLGPLPSDLTDLI